MAGVAGGVTDPVNGGGTPTLVARVSGRVATGAAEPEAAAVAAAIAGGLMSGWAASAVPAVAVVVAAAATAAAVVVEWLVSSGKAGRAAAG